MSHIRQDNAMAEEALRQDILNTAASLGDQSDLGVRPRFSAPRFIGIRFLPSQQYPNYLLFYRELSDRAIPVCPFVQATKPARMSRGFRRHLAAE